jgi:sugar fermentation stimulation protein A
MKYQNVRDGVFISRPNRFIAEVELDGRSERVHVKNTGRCRELLIPGTTIYLQEAANPNRSTQYDLIAVKKGKRLINMDANAPNAAFYEYLQSGLHIDGVTSIKPETKYGSSRFDFYVEARNRRIFIEVKGVTLEEDGVVMFPDAPTERGVKHLNELARCVREGYEAQVVFVTQMADVRYFRPNNRTHPAFGDTLVFAKNTGVVVAAFDCEVTSDSMTIGKAIEVRLNDLSSEDW